MKDYRKEIIETVAEDSQIPEHKVKACLHHVCHWIKHKMMTFEYDQFRWTKLGTFTRMTLHENAKLKSIDFTDLKPTEENESITTSSEITQCPKSNE